MSRHLLHGLLAAIVIVVGQTEAVSAQPAPSTTELEEARANFREGLQLSEKGRWKAAATKFRQVLLVQPAPAVQYNLAYALSESNELDDVAWLLDAVIGHSETPTDVRRKARELESTMNQRAAQLIIRRADLGENAVVRLDGRRLRLQGDVARVYVHPGTHNVRLDRDGKMVATTRAKVAKATVHHVAFADLTSVEAAPAARATGPVDSPTRKKLARDWRLWLSVGVALAAGVGVGVAVGRNAKSSNPTAQEPFEGSFTPGSL